MSVPRSKSVTPRIALLIAVLVFFPLLLVLFTLELIDVVLIWVVTRATRSFSIVWAFVTMAVLLAVFLGIGYIFSRSVESVMTSRPDPALEELRVAYARGDISTEEFRERRKLLRDEQE